MAERRESATLADDLNVALLRRELDSGLAGLRVDLPELSDFTVNDRQLVQLLEYLRLLLFWRARLSLIAVESPLEILREHVIDALAVAPWLPGGARIADLGSGGGFPGIPLAIFCPG